MVVRIIMCMDSDMGVEGCEDIDQGTLDTMSATLAAFESPGATGAGLGQNAELGAMATILSGSLQAMAKLSVRSCTYQNSIPSF